MLETHDGNILGTKPVVGSKSDNIFDDTVIGLVKRILNGYGLGSFAFGFDGGFDVYSSDVRSEVLDIQSIVTDIDDSILTLTETGGTLTTDGTEQNIYINDAPVGLYSPKTALIDFTNHTAGETVVVKEYYRIKAGGNYILHTTTSHAGAVSPELVEMPLIENRYGVKLTIEKTAGANRAYDWEVIYKI